MPAATALPARFASCPISRCRSRTATWSSSRTSSTRGSRSRICGVTSRRAIRAPFACARWWTRSSGGRWTSASTTSASRSRTCSWSATASTSVASTATCRTSPRSTRRRRDATCQPPCSLRRCATLAAMNQVYKNLALWMVIGLIVILLFTVFSNTQPGGQESPNFSEFLKAVEQGRVESVVIRGNLVTYNLRDGSPTQRTYIVDYPDLIKMLREKGVRIAVKPPDSNPWYAIFLQWVPMLLFIGVWIFFMRQMQGGGAKALSFGKARARLISEKQNKVTFQDVAGVDEAKEELREIIDFLKDPQKFQKLGGKIPKGVLLVGAPGTGKTLLARAISGEANGPFFSISGSDFVEMFVRVGASRVRDLFEQGKKNAPCIIFVDEIDAVGRHRGAGLGGGHDEREQTLNALLVEMDGFESNEGVILIAATNRPDVLDPALLRPGRFDRRVVVARPDVKGREEILRVHTRKVPIGDDVDISVLARGSPGFSGADLANLVNEAALLAARHNRKQVMMGDFESSKDKVLMGAERKSLILSEEIGRAHV